MSSDVYFYEMGRRLNDRAREPLQTWARLLGFGAGTDIDLPSENAGIVPDVAWRKRLAERERQCRLRQHPPIPLDPSFNVYEAARRGCGLSDRRDWSVGDNVQLAIGQGDVDVTPLQLATLYAAIENGGTLVRPHLASAIRTPQGGIRQSMRWPPRRHVDLESTGALDAVRDGLRLAARVSPGTSAQVFADWPKDRFPVYGKGLILVHSPATAGVPCGADGIGPPVAVSRTIWRGSQDDQHH